jgi:hypothetical protein
MPDHEFVNLIIYLMVNNVTVPCGRTVLCDDEFRITKVGELVFKVIWPHLVGRCDVIRFEASLGA